MIIVPKNYLQLLEPKHGKNKFSFQIFLLFSCDNASVMTGRYESFKTKLKTLQTFNNDAISLSRICISSKACSLIPEACEEWLFAKSGIVYL